MNKKLLIIIGVVLVVILVIVFSPRSDKSTPQTKDLIYSGATLLEFDPSAKTISQVDDETGDRSEIATTSTGEIISAELNPNGTQILYSEPSVSEDTVIDETMNPEAENLYIQAIGREKGPTTISNVFSPVWVDNNIIAYQDISEAGNGSIVLYSANESRELRRINIAQYTQKSIRVLNDTTLLISDYSSDIGDISSKTLDLTTGKFAEFITSYGFVARTLQDSPLLAYQTSKAFSGSVDTRVINWKTQKVVLSVSSPVTKVAWSQDSIYYIEGSNLIRFEMATGSKTTLKNSIPEQTSIAAIIGNALVLTTGEITENVAI